MTPSQIIDKIRPLLVGWHCDSTEKCVFAVVEEIKDGKLVGNSFAIQGTEVGLANLFYHLLWENPELANPMRFALDKYQADKAIQYLVEKVKKKGFEK